MRGNPEADAYSSNWQRAVYIFFSSSRFNIAVHGKDPAWMARFEAAKLKGVRQGMMLQGVSIKMAHGRHLLHEHPWSARSWSIGCVDDSLNDDRVAVVQSHMCGSRTTSRIGRDLNEVGPVAKPTGFVTTSWCNRRI